MHKGLSDLLNFLRWFSALVVLLSHLRRILFIDYAGVVDKNALTSLFYFCTGFGHQAVVVFFVVSGFLVGGSLLNKIDSGRVDLVDYSINRFSRLYVVLVPALLFTMAVGFILSHLDLPWQDSLNNNGHYPKLREVETDLITLLGNFFNLQTIYVSEYGYNLPLWSLAYEFWYYVAFPLSLILFSPFYNAKEKASAVVCLVLLCLLVSYHIILYFLMWLVGALASRVAIADRKVAFQALTVSTIFALLVVSRGSGFFGHLFLGDLCLALCISTLIVLYQRGGWVPFSASSNRFFSDFSYSLYLFHYPLIIGVSVVLYNLDRSFSTMQPSCVSATAYLFVLVTTIWMSYIASLATEANTGFLKSKIKNIF